VGGGADAGKLAAEWGRGRAGVSVQGAAEKKNSVADEREERRE